jgi:hypothetical protein
MDKLLSEKAAKKIGKRTYPEDICAIGLIEACDYILGGDYMPFWLSAIHFWNEQR